MNTSFLKYMQLDDLYELKAILEGNDIEKEKLLEIVAVNFLTLGKYLADMKDGTKLKLSVGSSGFKSTSTCAKNSSDLTYHQRNFVSAVAFGTSLEKLEEGNYEDCKRLLFLPREKNKTD